ncbi:hypothetical protein MIND_00936400 [Mycena indigotica]|uniref:F-box domain-containing protein n=1 Tax=Mycena indigotica TaxID=2126181 RepID=A0A8H6W2K1_9AGAR|nr:uncharacterized protein MIND_00936400 [Mycena indigotica]KAF7297039.1 hypothetical protein MIND_00936400 [Mycena indigotica]
MVSVLNDDIWIAVLSLCDVSTVLQVALTSRTLHRVSQCRTVWLSVLRDLTARGLVDTLTTAEDNYSTAAIIKHIRHTVCGPLSSTRSRRILKITPALHSTDPSLSAASGSVKLLPGGRYLTVVRPQQFDCIDVGTGRRAWSLFGAVHDYAVEMLNNGHSMRLGTVIRKVGERTSRIGIIDVDIDTGQAKTRLNISTGLRVNAELEKFSNTHMNGSFLSTTFKAHAKTFILLLNWRNDEYILFQSDFNDTASSLFTISNHIILATASAFSPHVPVLLQWSLKSFRHHWRATNTLSLRCAMSIHSATTPIPAFTTELHRHTLWDVSENAEPHVHYRIELFRDRLCRSRARLLVHLSGNIDLLPEIRSAHCETPRTQTLFNSTGLISKFRSRLRNLSPNSKAKQGNAGLLLRYTISCWPAPFDVFAVAATPTYLPGPVHELSYAGYANCSGGRVLNMTDYKADVKSATEPCLWTHLSPNGAVTTLVNADTVIIARS